LDHQKSKSRILLEWDRTVRAKLMQRTTHKQHVVPLFVHLVHYWFRRTWLPKFESLNVALGVDIPFSF